MARSIGEVNGDISELTEETASGIRQVSEEIYRLKVELTRACGHPRTVNEWAWRRCLNCGMTEITGYFVGIQKAAAVVA